MPFWRAVFAVIWCYPCFREIRDVAQQIALTYEALGRYKASRGLSFPSSPGLLAAGWIILTIMSRLPDPYWFVSFLAPLMLVPVQNAINRLNTVVAPNHNPNSRFSAGT
jgi:hypothetical protein